MESHLKREIRLFSNYIQNDSLTIGKILLKYFHMLISLEFILGFTGNSAGFVIAEILMI